MVIKVGNEVIEVIAWGLPLGACVSAVESCCGRSQRCPMEE